MAGRGSRLPHPAPSDKPFGVTRVRPGRGHSSSLLRQREKGRGGRYLPGAHSGRKRGSGPGRHQPHEPGGESVGWRVALLPLPPIRAWAFESESLRGGTPRAGTASNRRGSQFQCGSRGLTGHRETITSVLRSSSKTLVRAWPSSSSSQTLIK